MVDDDIERILEKPMSHYARHYNRMIREGRRFWVWLPEMNRAEFVIEFKTRKGVLMAKTASVGNWLETKPENVRASTTG